MSEDSSEADEVIDVAELLRLAGSAQGKLDKIFSAETLHRESDRGVDG